MVYRVKHKTFGDGIVTEINSDYIKIRFGNQTKIFQYPKAFGPFLVTDNEELLAQINDQRNNVSNKSESTIGPNNPSVHLSYPGLQSTTFFHTQRVPGNESLLGNRAQSIDFESESERFECIGYIANSRHVSSFEAEVPKDGRDQIFERLYPGQKYRPIETGVTPSGMPNKISSQFRINFIDLRNCPIALKRNIGKGNGGCVGRINKSRFVLELVQHYGFRFGDRQEVDCIRDIARRSGYLREFEKGYGA